MSPDPYAQAYAAIGTDFETDMAGLLGTVTVTQIDPDTDTNLTPAGATLGSAAGVPALKRVRHRQSLGIGEGELGADECRFTFAAYRVTWAVKVRDLIADATGINWQVERADLIAQGQLWQVDVVIKR